MDVTEETNYLYWNMDRQTVLNWRGRGTGEAVLRTPFERIALRRLRDFAEQYGIPTMRLRQEVAIENRKIGLERDFALQ